MLKQYNFSASISQPAGLSVVLKREHPMWYPGSAPTIISYKYGGLNRSLTIHFSDGTVYRWDQVPLEYKYVLDRTEDKAAAFFALMKPHLGDGKRILHLVDSLAE